MKRIIMFSGGIGSWACARRVADQFGTDGMVLLFADTLIEDEDLYRFLEEAAKDIGVPVTRLCDGRTPWQVFEDVRIIGNSRLDPCSRILKRELLNKWREDNCDPSNTITYFGIDWTEKHRLDAVKIRHAPWVCEAPLCGPPYTLKSEFLKDLNSRGITPPRLYGMGFPHNNCGGFCIKAGHAAFRLLLKNFPERYAHHEAEEKRLRGLGINGTILKDRRGGEVKPITLEEFRKFQELRDWARNLPDDEDLAAGCGCALD